MEQLVPDLRLTPADHVEVCLPDRADGEIEVWKGNDGFEAYGYEARGYFWVQLPGVGVFRFREDDTEVVAVTEPGVPEPVIEDAYHRNVLPLVLSLRGYEVLHASAVSTPEWPPRALRGVRDREVHSRSCPFRARVSGVGGRRGRDRRRRPERGCARESRSVFACMGRQ